MRQHDDALDQAVDLIRGYNPRIDRMRGFFAAAKLPVDGGHLEAVSSYHNMLLRQDVSDRAYSLTRIWMWFVIAATFLSGAKWGFAKGFVLSDGVLMTLIGASGAFGALAIVAKGVFSARRG